MARALTCQGWLRCRPRSGQMAYQMCQLSWPPCFTVSSRLRLPRRSDSALMLNALPPPVMISWWAVDAVAAHIAHASHRMMV